MSLPVARITRHDGGQSPDDTRGPAGSFAKGEQLDFRSSPSVVQLTPQMVEQSAGVVSDLLLDAALTPSGDIYFIGDTGLLYRRDSTTGNWTMEADLSEASGGSIFYRQDQDGLLIPLQTKVAYYGPLSSSPSVQVNKYAGSVSVDPMATRSGGGASLTLPSIGGVLSEAATNRCEFQSDIEPLLSINIKPLTKGTGNWTVYVHDDANTLIGSAALLNASIITGQWQRFDFTVVGSALPIGPYRLLVKPNARTYHWHIVSSDGTGTIAVGTAGDLSTADFQLEASRFVTTQNTLHPAIQFLQYNIYLNERYVAVHEPLEQVATNQEFQRHRLTFPSGFEGCGVALYREYVAVAVERQTTTGSQEYQNGIIFLWNGFDTTYIDAIPISEGSPRSLFSYENELYWQADGSWYTLEGRKPKRIRRFPGATEEYSGVYAQTLINPNMATVRKGVFLTGFPSNTNKTDIEHAVYSLGSLDRSYDQSFGQDFFLSTGSRFNNGSNNLTIGMVKNFGDELYVSWRDDSNNPNHYGVDTVSPLSTAATAGRYEALWFDAGLPEHDQLNHRMKVVCAALPAGCTLTPIFRTERDGAWTNENGAMAQATAGQTSVVLAVNARSTECQLGFIIATTGSNVKVRTVALEYDPLSENEAF